MLLKPPDIEEFCPDAVFCWPPITEEGLAVALLLYPPITDAHQADDVFCWPPITEE